jgi:hypothetical protein
MNQEQTDEGGKESSNTRDQNGKRKEMWKDKTATKDLREGGNIIADRIY